MRSYLCILLFLLAGSQVSAQELTIRPIVNLQLWSIHTTGHELYDESLGQYVPVGDRLNFQLRRSRLGFKGKYGDRLSYSLVTAIDGVGRDIYVATYGPANNGASPTLRFWNSSINYRLTPDNDALHVKFGYFAPEVTRESITSPFRVSGFEKLWSQNYIRRHVAGSGPGRVMGVVIGGMKIATDSPLAVSYDFGIYNPYFNQNGGNTAGANSSNIISGRVVAHIGDPEFSKYGAGRKDNHFGQRRGVSVGLSATYQGETTTWEQNGLTAIDLLANYDALSFMGEWAFLNREGGNASMDATVIGMRVGYNVRLDDQNLEFTIGQMILNGATSQADQDEAIALGAFYGEDRYTELNVNWYMNKHVKLSLSYTLNSGDPGYYDSPGSGNNYFTQAGESITRGDFLGIGLNFVY